MANDLGGVWRTIGGRRVFIKDGEDLATAMKKSGKFKSKKAEKEVAKVEKLNDEQIQELHNEAEEASKKLSEEEKKAIYNYADRGYEEINETLAKGETLYDYYNNDDEIKKDIANIDKAIKQSEIKKDIVVFRGTSDEFWNNMQIGDVKELPTYSSTSLKESIAQKFARKQTFKGKEKAVLEIKVPKNSQAMYIGDIYRSTNEYEVLIGRDTKYKLIGKKVVDPSYYENGIYHQDVKYTKYTLEVVK